MLTLEQLLEQTTVNTDKLLAPKTKDDKKVETPADWKAKNPVTNARLVSFEHNGENVLYLDVNVHYVKNKSGDIIDVFLCPKVGKYGKECPMCDFGWSEYNRIKALNMLEKDKSFKRFLPSQEHVSLFIERDTEEADFTSVGYPILKCFKYPNKVKKQIDVFLADPEYGNIAHLVKGTDIKINFDKVQAAKQELSLTITAARTSSPVFNKKFADHERDFDTFKDVYEKMMSNACSPLDRFGVRTGNEILEVMKKMSEETSDKAEVEAHGEDVADSNISEESKMAALQRDLQQEVTKEVARF